MPGRRRRPSLRRRQRPQAAAAATQTPGADVARRATRTNLHLNPALSRNHGSFHRNLPLRELRRGRRLPAPNRLPAKTFRLIVRARGLPSARNPALLGAWPFLAGSGAGPGRRPSSRGLGKAPAKPSPGPAERR
jgi:hypothetical protein